MHRAAQTPIITLSLLVFVVVVSIVLLPLVPTGKGGLSPIQISGGGGGCSGPADCNDNNACTKDLCTNGACSYQNEPNGFAGPQCAVRDGSGRYTGERGMCQNGKCVSLGIPDPLSGGTGTYGGMNAAECSEALRISGKNNALSNFCNTVGGLYEKSHIWVSSASDLGLTGRDGICIGAQFPY